MERQIFEERRYECYENVLRGVDEFMAQAHFPERLSSSDFRCLSEHCTTLELYASKEVVYKAFELVNWIYRLGTSYEDDRGSYFWEVKRNLMELINFMRSDIGLEPLVDFCPVMEWAVHKESSSWNYQR